MTIIGKHTEAANKAIERAAGYPGDDPATAAARIVLAFAHELDAAGDVGEETADSWIPQHIAMRLDADERDLLNRLREAHGTASAR